MNKAVFVVVATAVVGVACGPSLPSPDKFKGLGIDCPAGTSVDLSAQSNGQCQGGASANITNQSGNITAACMQGSGYAYKCVVDSTWCKNGAKTLTKDMLVCAEASPSAPAGSAAPASSGH